MYKHKGSGIIVANIFQPMRSIASSLAKTVVKQFAKKALQSGILHVGDKLGKKDAEKKKKLTSQFNKSKPQSITTRPNIPVRQEESADMIMNRLISG